MHYTKILGRGQRRRGCMPKKYKMYYTRRGYMPKNKMYYIPKYAKGCNHIKKEKKKGVTGQDVGQGTHTNTPNPPFH